MAYRSSQDIWGEQYIVAMDPITAALVSSYPTGARDEVYFIAKIRDWWAVLPTSPSIVICCTAVDKVMDN